MMPDFKTIYEFTLFLVLGGLAVALGIAIERNRLQAEAIAHGAATWIVTPTGATEFTWKANFTGR